MQINVKPMPSGILEVNSLYNVSTYPETGAYYHEISDTLFFVNKPGCSVIPVGVNAKIYLSSPLGEDIKVSNEIPGIMCSEISNTLTNINDILKIIAVCNKPELVKDLT